MNDKLQTFDIFLNILEFAVVNLHEAGYNPIFSKKNLLEDALRQTTKAAEETIEKQG